MARCECVVIPNANKVAKTVTGTTRVFVERQEKCKNNGLGRSRTGDLHGVSMA
jgi:hypothetical protein